MAKDQGNLISSGEEEEEVSTSALDLADRILTQGLVPAAQEVVYLSQHSDNERLRGAMSKVVLDYHLKKLLKRGRGDDDFWEDFKKSITEDASTGAED